MTLSFISIPELSLSAKEYFVFGIGIFAQIFFSARLILQWILSEKAKKVLSPNIFWILSLVASYLLFIYGWLRNDFAIILGQIIAYYIYIWNLNKKGVWQRWYYWIRVILTGTPVIAALLLLQDIPDFLNRFFRNEEIPMWLIIYGSLGQIIFTFRFVYQWLYSRKKGESLLPMGFWVISLTGSLIIISYAILRKDPVLILGQSPGILVYCRNIWLSRKTRL